MIVNRDGKRGKILILDMELTPAQMIVDAHPARFKSVEAGRRWGKSDYAEYWITKNSAAPRTRHWWIAKTLKQAKEIIWRKLLEFIPRELYKKKNATDLTIETTVGSIITLKGSDQNDDDLRGPKLDSVVFEEAAFQRKHIFPEIIRPQLADSRGPALFISSPKGKGWHHQMTKMAMARMDNLWAGFHGTIYDNPHISREEIESLKNDPMMTDIVWRQEYMGEALSFVGQVYDEWSDKKNVFISGTDYSGFRDWPCVRGMDWGYDDPTAVVWLCVPIEGPVVAMYEHVQNRWGVVKHVDVMNTRSRGMRLEADILDVTAFRAEGTSETTIAKQFRANGIPVSPSDKNKDGGIDIVKRYIEGDEKGPWLKISSDCPKVIKSMGDWEYGGHEPDELAALRYGLTYIHKRNLCSLAKNFIVRKKVHDQSLERVGPNGQRFIRIPVDDNFEWNSDDGVPAGECGELDGY